MVAQDENHKNPSNCNPSKWIPKQNQLQTGILALEFWPIVPFWGSTLCHQISQNMHCFQNISNIHIYLLCLFIPSHPPPNIPEYPNIRFSSIHLNLTRQHIPSHPQISQNIQISTFKSDASAHPVPPAPNHRLSPSASAPSRPADSSLFEQFHLFA